MPHDISKTADIIALQGQTILVKRPGTANRLFTFVHVVDEKDGQPVHSLRMVFRVNKTRRVDWPVSQKFFDAAKPATGVANWQITVK